jgi:hypothetical protein
MSVLILKKYGVIATFADQEVKKASSMAVMNPLVVILACSFMLFQSAPKVDAASRYKKEVVPPLSSEQYEEIKTLNPDPEKPVYVHLKVTIERGDLSKLELTQSCGVPDVDWTISTWVWNTYHYRRDLSGVKSVKVRVNSPIIRSPQVHLSWRTLQELRRADPLNEGKSFVSRFNIEIQGGKIVDVQLLKSCGLPLVDQECSDFIRTRWVAAEGANQNFITSLRTQRGYYPR